MQRHAQIGHDILAGTGVELLEQAATLALTRHERYDGTGYPQGLAGEAIPIEGRIAAIADVFHALTSPRVYRPALHLDHVLRVLREGSGSHFDPALLDLFLAHLDGVLDLVDEGPHALPEAA